MHLHVGSQEQIAAHFIVTIYRLILVMLTPSPPGVYDHDYVSDW